MSILGDIGAKGYQDMKELCDFSVFLHKEIKNAVKEMGFQCDIEKPVIEYWDNNNRIAYGSYFPKGAGDTELKFWVGLLWLNEGSEDNSQTCEIVFYVRIPVNMLYFRPIITKQLDSYKHGLPYPEYTFVLKVLPQSATDEELKKSIVEALKPLQKIIMCEQQSEAQG